MSKETILKELKPSIRKNWEAFGFPEFTTIQAKAIPHILKNTDVVCESPTGTGKTLAYLLPCLHKINEENKGLQAIILAPSRELVMQITDQVRTWSKGTEIKCTPLIGGGNIKKQIEKLKDRPQIIVGTTGRIIELMKMKKLKTHEVKTIIVDEADQLVSDEHFQHIRDIIKSTLKDRQVLFFSATISTRTEEIAKTIMKDPEIIRVNREKQSSNVDHIYFSCEQRDKVDFLRKLISTKLGKSIVFIKSLEKIAEVEAKLKYHGYPVAVLAGESTKQERVKTMKDIRTGKITTLLTTDVAARGLDIENITHVIHFDFPKTDAQYLHRSGRTGRMGKKGTVISLVNAIEESFLKKMSKQLGLTFTKMRLYEGKITKVKEK